MSKILMIFAAFTGLILSELPTQARSIDLMKEESTEGRLRPWVSHKLSKEQLRNIVQAAKFSRIYYKNASANAEETPLRFDVPSKKRSNKPALRDTFKQEQPVLGSAKDAAPHLTYDELMDHLLRTWGSQLN
ncbi:MAG: hypothetical protein BGO67_12935 [Alphaproteobacteria bacterium 41-28]|nr:MAG: hypothetical protein BGO67_12935 [Alphaproteobacteria bacterium 41-28]